MEHHKINVRKVGAVSAVITLLTFAVILFVIGEDGKTIFQSLLKSGASLTVTGLFWAFYEKFGWRLRGFRFFGWLSPLPDLNGRWEGTVCRNVNDEPRPFVIEIVQTFSSINFTTFSKNSEGRSSYVSMFADKENNVFGAVAHWQTQTKKIGGSDSEIFTGTSVWRLEFDDKPGDFDDRIKIVDKYYTARSPATAGRVEVRRVSRKLKNGFA